MKKLFLGIILCICAFSLSGCKKSLVDREEYRAIDPFDYKLDERNAPRGDVRKFKSVVRFGTQSGKSLTFVSLDQGTTLSFPVHRNFLSPTPGQRLTVYYTATKRLVDVLVLDEIDYRTTTEEGINLVKSEIPDSAGIDRDEYISIDPFDYKIEAEHAEHDDVRKYKSDVMFLAQSGLTYYFSSHTDNHPEGTPLSLRADRRFPHLESEQEVTIYYTATKGVVDLLSLDDIEL